MSTTKAQRKKEAKERKRKEAIRRAKARGTFSRAQEVRDVNYFERQLADLFENRQKLRDALVVVNEQAKKVLKSNPGSMNKFNTRKDAIDKCFVDFDSKIKELNLMVAEMKDATTNVERAKHENASLDIYTSIAEAGMQLNDGITKLIGLITENSDIVTGKGSDLPDESSFVTMGETDSETAYFPVVDLLQIAKKTWFNPVLQLWDKRTQNTTEIPFINGEWNVEDTSELPADINAKFVNRSIHATMLNIARGELSISDEMNSQLGRPSIGPMRKNELIEKIKTSENPDDWYNVLQEVLGEIISIGIVLNVDEDLDVSPLLRVTYKSGDHQAVLDYELFKLAEDNTMPVNGDKVDVTESDTVASVEVPDEVAKEYLATGEVKAEPEEAKE